ncbi:unnamed protein product [Rhodiola kirilowii]
MVFPLGPGKFYGSSLPRPRIYTDIKFNHERVDPPVSVADPFLSWANEAHWSMGGLSTKRLRLQGRIEGNISRLRADNEKLSRKKSRADSVTEEKSYPSDSDEPIRSPSPPPAPVAGARKRRLSTLIEEEEEEVDKEEEVRVLKRKKPARKLINEFNSVATEKTVTRRSPRSASKSGFRKSSGGSFVSKMLKASERVKSTVAVELERCDEEEEEESIEAKLKKLKSARGSPKVRTSPRLMKKKL